MTGKRLFLIGFSFSGKTQVGRRTAEQMGWRYVDTDDLVVQEAGKPIPRIFAEDGEERFRQIEKQVLARVCRRTNLVVATGGGIILDEANRSAMVRHGVVVCLEAQPETVYRRLLRDSEEGAANPVVRPLLQGSDPLQRIRRLKEFRQPFYASAHWTVHTDNLTLEEVAEEVVRGWQYVSRDPKTFSGVKGTRSEAQSPYCAGSRADLVVQAASGSYPVYMKPLSELGERLGQCGLSGSAYVISDENVFALHGPRVEESLRLSGFRVTSYCIPPGEESKSLAMLSRLYDWLLAQGPERGHAIVALGGGVVGDLAGLAAATLLRGIPYVQAPTSLLAMVDSSVGGKTAINHPTGKNLIGAFYQPRLVLLDTTTLRTLPARELASGWAEVIKHGLIRDATYFKSLQDRSASLLALDQEAIREAVLGSVTIKADIVGRDERETTGERSLLNYGHTLAHGLEAAAGYGRLLHGEAVAIGMAGAGFISREMGLLSPEKVDAQEKLLKRFGLATRCANVDRDRVLDAMSLDKKMRSGKMRWVLLEDIGSASLHDDVPQELASQALDLLLA
ncbi:MAG: 3-dehydroquinate synthase [Dehalococcoidia bacterium]|nr:3-dehydroquinate synthase [Dehalococcoidia bacterium]